MNNPTLGEFCFATVGRADIEGSKSDVAKNAWPPQASSRYPVARARAPERGRRATSRAYPWVGGLGEGTLSGGGRLYLKLSPTPCQSLRRAASSLPPGRRAGGRPCRLLVDPIHEIMTRTLPTPSTPGCYPGRLGTRGLARVFPATRCVASSPSRDRRVVVTPRRARRTVRSVDGARAHATEETSRAERSSPHGDESPTGTITISSCVRRTSSSIPVVTFLTPLASNLEPTPKDR